MPTQRQLLRLHVQLLDVHPVIWRRIEIRSDVTFWALHVALQNAMGWTDSHLHDFELPNADAGEPIWIGMPDLDGDDYREVRTDFADVGGPGGYEIFLEALADPEHAEHDEYQRWIGGSFDPELFDPEKVRFENPARRLREVYDFA